MTLSNPTTPDVQTENKTRELTSYLYENNIKYKLLKTAYLSALLGNIEDVPADVKNQDEFKSLYLYLVELFEGGFPVNRVNEILNHSNDRIEIGEFEEGTVLDKKEKIETFKKKLILNDSSKEGILTFLKGENKEGSIRLESEFGVFDVGFDIEEYKELSLDERHTMFLMILNFLCQKLDE